jgi:prokaryotic ubiquitin-like protein Pup
VVLRQACAARHGRRVPMSETGRTTGASSARERVEPEAGPPSPGTRAEASRPLLDDVDGLLDEIDQVLEVNAEEFVRGYVQKGGQ